MWRGLGSCTEGEVRPGKPGLCVRQGGGDSGLQGNWGLQGSWGLAEGHGALSSLALALSP